MEVGVVLGGKNFTFQERIKIHWGIRTYQGGIKYIYLGGPGLYIVYVIV